jgi:hypothetical protein
MPNEEDDLIQTEITRLQDAALKVWAMYINWFTWSLGLNLLAVSFITTREKIRPDFLTGVSSIMTLSIVLAIVAAFKMRSYYSAVIARMDALVAKSQNPSMDTYLMIGGGIGSYAAWAVPIVHIAALVGWAAAGLKYGGSIFD